jgi:hypothetical protein
MHLHNKVLTITMLSYLAALLLLFAITPDRDFSEAENRMLQKMPDCTWESLISGKFNLAAENYLSDQFPGRDAWVGLKSAIELLLLKKDNNGVYFGRDGYLLPMMEGINMATLGENMETINRFAETFPGQVCFLPAPSAAQILQEKLPPFAAPREQLELQKTVEEQLAPGIHLIDAPSALAAHKGEYIYYKTDHHWTSKGAYYAYVEAGKALGYNPLELNDFIIEQVSDDFYGTLYSKSGHRFARPDSIQLFLPNKEQSCQVEYEYEKRTTASLYAMDWLQKKDQYAVFLGGNHALVRITASNETGRKLLVIKDSYANSMVPFLINHFDEIHLIDLRHFNSDLRSYIEQHGLGEVLFVYNTTSFAGDPSIRKLGTYTKGLQDLSPIAPRGLGKPVPPSDTHLL